MGLLKVMLEQIQDHDLSAWTQDVVRGGDGAGWVVRVVQCLAQDHQVNALGLDRRLFQIAQTEFQILNAVFFRFRGSERNNFLRIIDRNDLFGSSRQQLTEQPFAGTEIRHYQRGRVRSSICPKACQERPGP